MAKPKAPKPKAPSWGQIEHRVIFLTVPDLLQRLRTAEQELMALAPAPRVELDREAVLSMVQLARQALDDLTRVQ